MAQLELVGPSRQGSRSDGHFQDILAAAARERSERAAGGGGGERGPRPMDMASDGGEWDDEVAQLGAGGGGESGFIVACTEACTDCAKCYIWWQGFAVSCFECAVTCGGCLRLSDDERRSWGFRDHEQPARFNGDLGGDGAAQAARSRRAAARRARQLAGREKPKFPMRV